MIVRETKRGAALMMVMVILALLLVLAVSFTFLMTQQEGTSVASLGGEQTRIITRTGADHAYSRLNGRSRLNEFDRWWDTPPSDVTHEDNPWVDWQGELTVDLLADIEGFGEQEPLFPGLIDSNGNSRFRVEDPKRHVLGMNVQDETGKINLNFATPQLIGNLIGSSWVTGPTPCTSTGGVYPEIRLDDAAFLTTYDQRLGDSKNSGGGFVVINNQLFSYSYRRGNVLFNCVPNPTYLGADGTNAFFTWRRPDREIVPGEFVTTPTAYKIAYYLWMQSTDGETPALYNSIGDVRRIAGMDRWFRRDVTKAPDILGARLDGWPEGIDPVMYQWLEENATVMGTTERFDGGWYNPHVVTWADMGPVGESGLDALYVRYDAQYTLEPGMYVPGDARAPVGSSGSLRWPRAGIGAGNLVRLRRLDSDPQQTILGYVLGGGGGSLTLCVRGDHQVSQNEAWIIECAERAEVNINAANFDTLVALFHGVGPRGQNESSRPISLADARSIASAILSERTRDYDRTNEFEDMDDLLQFLSDLSKRQPAPINSSQIGHFANLQRYPYASHNVLMAKVRFDSLDTYMVDAYATRYQPSGGAMARDGFREWVQIGADTSRTWRWYTLQMMQDEVRAGQGNILSYPRPAGIVNRRSIGMVELPYLHYPLTERLARQWRQAPWDTRQTHNMYNLGQDAGQRREKFYIDITDTNATILPGSAVNTGEYGDLDAGMFSFWYRPQWEDLFENHYLFDVAEQEFSNRMSLLWWGDRRGAHNMSGKNSGLTYRIKDRTLEPAYTEMRYEMDEQTWRDKEWYHLAMNWKGTELGHQSLLIDGDASVTGQGATPVTPVVNHTYQINGDWVSRTSVLMHDLEDPRWDPRTQFDIQIHPDDIDAFPPSGVIVIGNEAIEYAANDGFALLSCYRGPARIDYTQNPPVSVPGTAIGARGTVASFHPEGSPVTVFGYTSPIRAYEVQDAQPAPPAAGTPISMQPRWPFLPGTSANLTTELGDGTIYRLSNVGTNNNLYYRPGELGPNAGLPGAGDAALGGDPNHLKLADYAGLPEQGVVMIRGLAWMGYYEPGTPRIPDNLKYYPNWNDDGTITTQPDPLLVVPPAQLANQWASMLQTEYLVYDGIHAAGLNIIGRYDTNFERKPETEWWHFLGEFDAALFNGSVTAWLDYWSQGACVVLCNIPVSNVTGYHNRSVVQVGNEWMFYNVKWDTSSPNPDWDNTTPTGADDHRFDTLIYINSGTMISYISQANSQYVNGGAAPVGRPWRGAMNTTKSAHAGGSPVVPTFGTTVTTGAGDVVTTILDKNKNKELHQIRVQRQLWTNLTGLSVWNFTSLDGTEFICALDTHVRFDYAANTLAVTDDLTVSSTNWRGSGGNLCKFPTGELPVELPTEWSFAGADERTPDGNSQGAGYNNSGDFDAFEFRAFSRGDFRLVRGIEDDVPGEGGDIYVNRPITQRLGVIKIDDELIAYRNVDAEDIRVWNPVDHVFEYRTVVVLKDITRGVLGTIPAAHSGDAVLSNGGIHGGAAIMNMASLRMGRPVQAAGTRENEIELIFGEERYRPDYGFVRIEQQTTDLEIFGYQENTPSQIPDPDNPGQLIPTEILLAGRYNDPNYPQALFRGAFGTRAQFYGDRALFFDQPVRFPDWFPGWHVDEDGDWEPFQYLETDGIPGCNSPEVSHYQGSIAFRNSLFEEFKWRVQYAPLADISRHSNAIGARLVMRFKRRGEKLPDWGDIPTNSPGGLYSFEFDPTLPNCIEERGKYWEQTQDFTDMRDTPFGVQAERVEWRVYFYFKQQAFERDNYKITLNFQGAEVTLHQRTRIMRHEEKR